MAGQGKLLDRGALVRNFSRLGIPVTDDEISRIETSFSAMTAGLETSGYGGAKSREADFDVIFEREKKYQNPSPNQLKEMHLEPEGKGAKELFPRVVDIQSQFGCFVKIFDTPYGNNGNGVPIAVKDVFGFGAHRPTAGVPGRSDYIHVSESPAIDRLIQAGASIIGTTKLPPWCYLPVEYNPSVSPPNNPLGDGLLVGGSSSGSAVAVASGLVPAALGTDTGGSVRIPAALTGLYGFKPSLGRISVEGVVPLGETQDTVGIISRTVDWLSRFFTVLKEDRVDLGNRPLRIGCPANAFDNSNIEMVQAADIISGILLKLGATITRCSPLPFGDLNQNAGLITGFEAARLHQQGLMASPEDYVGSVRERLLVGLSIDEKIYRQQMGRRAGLLDFVLRQVFADKDILLLPSVNCYAPTRALCPEDDPAAVARMTLDLLSTNRWVNLLGLPSMTLPVSLPGKFIPASVQFVGKPYRDEELIELAAKVGS